MPSILHPKAAQAIEVALSAGLKHIQIKNGYFLDGFTTFVAAYEADQALPTNGKLRDKLIDYLDEYPFVEFITETLRRDLSDKFEYEPDPSQKKLLEIEEYSNAENTSKFLVELFSSLPWEYTYSLPLPKSLIYNDILNENPISFPDSRIALSDLLTEEIFPLNHENKKVRDRLVGGGALSELFIGPLKWDAETPYYQAKVDGFVRIYGGGNTTDRVERGLESFLGLGLSNKLFSYFYRYENSTVTPKWTVHKWSNDAWEPCSRFDLNREVAEVLRHMTAFRFEDSYPEESRAPWIRKASTQLHSIFSSEYNTTILLAAKWFFDSFKGSDSALRYVRLMTTLEILLGEHANTSKSSLGELLGNRLAYLIGKNHQDRLSILADFKKIYGVRSGILHHGKHKLRGEERSYLSRLQNYCERAIQEESRLLLA